MSNPRSAPFFVRASDLVGCRFRLRQRVTHPGVEPSPGAQSRAEQVEAARTAVFSRLPVKRALGDGSARRFVRVDVPGPHPFSSDSGTSEESTEESTEEDTEEATRAAMAEGANLITGARLTGRVAGVDVEAEIDVLVRADDGRYMPVFVSNHRVARAVPGEPSGDVVTFIPTSRLGLGRPLEVAARPRHHTVDGYRLALAHLVLGERSAGVGGVIGQDRTRAYLATPERFIAPLLDALEAPTPLEPRRLKQCASCRFWELCEPRLHQLDDISLVFPGGNADRLREAGITTVNGAIAANLGEKSRIAQAWRDGVPVLKRSTPTGVRRADVEVDVDMEAYLDQGAYLWGTFDGEAYRPFVTWEEVGGEAEAENFRQFWTWLMATRDDAHAAGRSFAAYCYAAGGENHWLLESARRFGGVAPEEVREFIASDEWVDVFSGVRRHLVGTDGLGLKVVGPVAGFRWADEDVDGQQSVALRRAARLGSTEARTTLLRYNEGDCRATRAVREFLSAGAPGVPVV
ncbi:hypothetical protein CAPI_08975 [Corynebacterium capitovis DSM 44611]|uniref:TM0106 family RecB-like putative nuclease n=1 Tax=Corynebacterium capitovis TaxID=131081 RepID=UPI00037F015B|nr:TM0106 family RecB-like putative nuclease [Corynebacterium capitovis]WKD58321.1 hypothetical protein CAPI_08975 [Corynebacterium capitovis DSM 44611]